MLCPWVSLRRIQDYARINFYRYHLWKICAHLFKDKIIHIDRNKIKFLMVWIFNENIKIIVFIETNLRINTRYSRFFFKNFYERFEFFVVRFYVNSPQFSRKSLYVLDRCFPSHAPNSTKFPFFIFIFSNNSVFAVLRIYIFFWISWQCQSLPNTLKKTMFYIRIVQWTRP